MISTGVNVHNTLGDSLQPLMRERDQPLKVYTCGPTVYSDSHLGHARTYVSLDMIRRILTDHFKVPVIWSMNITDIDDKIINAFNSGKTGFSTVFEYSKNRESAFFSDLSKLNVKLPDAILRVTEVIPNIIEFIEDLIVKGFAYPSGGSVYFDVGKYENDERFVYAELERESYLSTLNHENPSEIDEAASTKLNRSDFVLWKAAKPNEPFWDSPWGPGRPGWHIECSAMSYLFYGTHFDCHCGGIDLRFPHHSNELAQSQARFGVVPWVTTWLHTGQLKINGEKMSKSLGNLKTISQTLEQYTPRQIRMLFALANWQNVLELTEGQLERAISLDQRINNFLQMANTKLKSPVGEMKKGFTKKDQEFSLKLEETERIITESFSKNFDIPSAIMAISNLIDIVYSTDNLIDTLIISAARIVYKLMNLLGFIEENISFSQNNSINLVPFAKTMADHRSIARRNGIETIDLMKKLIQDLKIDLKKDINHPQYQLIKELDLHIKNGLKHLDMLRDDALPSLGIRIEDVNDGSVNFKVCDPEEIIAMKKSKENQQKIKQIKEIKKPIKVEKLIEHPSEVLRRETDKYSAWNDEGFPTHDKEGNELTKSAKNRIKKWWGIQLKKLGIEPNKEDNQEE